MVSIGVATLGLLYGFFVSNHWIWVLLIATSGLFWVYGWLRKLEMLSSLLLVGFTALSVLGILINLPPFGFLIGLLAALSAWDLDRFEQRIRQAGKIENERAVVLKHFLNLAAVDGLGLIVGSMALLLRIRLDFGLVLLVGLVAVIGLSLVFNYIKREISRI